MRNHIPCMVHIIHLALGAFMSSHGVKGHSNSWEAHERNQQFGENESTDSGKCQRLWKEENARINKVSAMRPGLAKIIETVHISRHFERHETDLHIAENACCFDYTDLVIESSSVTVKKPKYESQYYLVSMWLHDGNRHWSCCSEPTDYENSPVSGSRIQNTVITGHSSQHRINVQWSSKSWRLWGHSDTAPCGCRSGIWVLCITSSLSTMSCSIIWKAISKLQPRGRINGR